jgi:glyoxylase-like metal-dependent hydrolase (beta-lactamase superfamily II)
VTGAVRDAVAEVALRRIVVGPLQTNCWVVHASGSRQALLVDPGDEPERILDAVADLQVTGIVLSHAHFDHVLAVPDVAAALGAPVLAHADDAPVWPHELATLDRNGHFDAGTATADLLAAGHSLRPDPRRTLWDGRIDRYVDDGEVLAVGPLRVRVHHTPGHTPGGLSLAVSGGTGQPRHVLTGDTLFPGGPGLTGWPLSDFPTILTSVRRLLDLPADTVVHPGHGPDTTVAAERPALTTCASAPPSPRARAAGPLEGVHLV